MTVQQAPLAIAPEVAEALARGRPVVALRSTIITHGMPWPENLATAGRVEAAVRAEDAVPATIAVAEGRIHVGLEAEALGRWPEPPTWRNSAAPILPWHWWPGRPARRRSRPR